MLLKTVMTFVTVSSWLSIANADEVPNISGTYNVATLTPLERPVAFGNNLYLSKEEASRITNEAAAFDARANADSDPERDAPKEGGNVGGYNMFWIDRGDSVVSVDGRFRTSIISSPANGRIPKMTLEGRARLDGFLNGFRIIWRNPDPTVGKNTGTAWWLNETTGPGPYDDLEQRPLAERCIIGSRSTAGPPMLPNLYNNFKRIIQTKDSIMILTEMNHDVRVVRMNAQHRPAQVKTWLGDSIGSWKDGVLEVDTTNFTSTPPLSGADENLHVVEYFKLTEGGLNYSFIVEDKTVWSEPWGGEYFWPSVEDKVYEYACHEGNYALGNIMRGARVLEGDAM